MILKKILSLICILISFLPLFAGDIPPIEKLLIDRGLTDINSIDPSIKVDLKYSSADNFLKEDVYGDLNHCYLQNDAAVKLGKAQKILKKTFPGFSLIIYDGARPLAIQKKMWDIVKGTKQEPYVANPAAGSIHNFGAAVDLSIVDETGAPLDMGTPFDFFGDLAQPRLEEKYLKEGKLTKQHVRNRQLLRNVMTEAGFIPLMIEWWHFDAFTKKEIKEKYKIIN